MKTRGEWGLGLALTLFVWWCALAPDRTPAQSPLRWRDIRGTNYLPAASTSDNNIQMWLPHTAAAGTFDTHLVNEELGALARFGANSIRVFGSFFAFAASPADYERDLSALLDACRRHRLRITFVVWDAFGQDGLDGALERAPSAPGPEIQRVVAGARQTLRRHHPTLPAAMGGFWFASPGRAYHAAHPSPSTWTPAVAAHANRYLDLLASLFGGAYADVFHAYDLYNEPENLLLVPSMTYGELVRISADLCAYTLARLGRHQPALAFTVGTAFIHTGHDIDLELRRRRLPPFDYLSYHDYDHPASCLHRAALARYYGVVSGRDVVCSEFHQAARQGGLWSLLQALHQLQIGGQIWGFLQDRVFVVEFPELQALLGGRDRCWFHESGLIRPEADAHRPGGFRFAPIDPVKCAAFATWAAGLPLPAHAPPGVQVTRVPSTLPTRYRLIVTGRAAQPAWLFAAPPGAARTRWPGLGAALLSPLTQVVPLGPLRPTGPSAAGVWQQDVIPLVHPILDVELQALVGNDYAPAHWRLSRLSALSTVVRVTL